MNVSNRASQINELAQQNMQQAKRCHDMTTPLMAQAVIEGNERIIPAAEELMDKVRRTA